jgi:hypothetical protein
MKHTTAKEDCLTEYLAATLRDDDRILRDFVRHLCGDEVDGISTSTVAIDCDTQVNLAEGHACVDMVFRLGGKLMLGVENKLNSPEGISPAGER